MLDVRLTLRPYRAVLFDFFGTLTHAVRRGPAHASIARGLGCDPEAFLALLDATFQSRARGRYGPPAEMLRHLALALGARPSPEQLAAAVAARVTALRTDTRLRPEAVPVLRAARQRGMRTALVSDCTHELPRFLPALPVAPLLDACVYSVFVAACKPEPMIYLTACERLGVPPQRCLYVGDGGGRELSGARAVGMDAVRLDAPDLVDHLRFDPEIGWSGPAIRTLAEVPALLDRGVGAAAHLATQPA
jgi:putative hydrolase of the HAD superfamily